MKRLRHSQVRGISIKLQEEERERRDNYVPEVSALEHDIIEVDPETKDMLKMLVSDILLPHRTLEIPSVSFIIYEYIWQLVTMKNYGDDTFFKLIYWLW